jgi:hypothetical protein
VLAEIRRLPSADLSEKHLYGNFWIFAWCSLRFII